MAMIVAMMMMKNILIAIMLPIVVFTIILSLKDMPRREGAWIRYICIWSWWSFDDYGDDHHDEAVDDGDDHHDDAVADGDYHAIYDSVDKMTREGGGCLPLSATVNRRFGLDALCSNIT